MFHNKNELPTVGSRQYSDQFSSTILKEAYDFFNESNIQMVSGFFDILSEDGLFEQYKDMLSKGLEPDEVEQIGQIMENARMDILKESSISQISPVAGLSMPTIRKMWLKTCLKNAIPTEVAKYPTFKISYMLPYLLDSENNKHYLPEAINDYDNTLAEKKRLISTPIDVSTDAINIIEKSSGVVRVDYIDPIFFIESVVVEADGKETEIVINAKLSLDNQIYKQFTFTDNKKEVTETLFGSLDLETGLLELTSFKKKVKKFKIKGWFSSENNNHTTTASMELKNKDVRIGTGEHIDAILPIEMLQDTMALYNIDATSEIVETMSQIVAFKLDQEIYQFLKMSFENQPTKFCGKFDVKPSAGYAGLITQWRSELKSTIDWWANKMKSSTGYNRGYFTIVGNRLDISLLQDVKWTFKGSVSEKGGVSVDYDLGAATYNNTYLIISSDLVPQGKLRIFFVPTENDKMTYKYYPYSFNVEKGYRSPKNVTLPSIMMTKRHTIAEFLPCQGVIDIIHNDGSLISSYLL